MAIMTKDDLLKKLVLQYKDSIAFSRELWANRILDMEMYMGVKPKKRYKSEANFNVPYASTLLDNVWPLLTNKLPFAEVVPNDTKRDGQAAKLMQELVRYTFEKNNFENKFLMSQKESMLAGNTWAEVCWDYTGEDRDFPLIRLLNTMDVRVHRNKVELDDRWPIFITMEMTKQEMKERGWDEKAIDSLSKTKTPQNDGTRAKKQALGLQSEPGYVNQSSNAVSDDDLYEVVKTYLKMKLTDKDKFERVSEVVFANQEKIINMPGDSKDFVSPYEEYDKSMYPIAMLAYNPMPHTVYAESFIRPIYDMQVELNALENMKADNYKRRNNPPLKVRRSGQIDIDSLQFVAGLPWFVDEPDDITAFELPDLANSIHNQQMYLKEQMQARTGANDVLLVTDESSLKGGDTAMGANIANENTKMRFKPQASLIDHFIRRIGTLTINRWKQPEFFDTERLFDITGEDGQQVEMAIGPSSIEGKFQFKVKSSTSLAESDSAKLNKYIQLKGLFQNEDNPALKEEIDSQIFQAAGLDYKKVKPNMDQSVEQLSMTLEKLMGVAQSPDFKRRPVAVQQEVLAQIKQIKNTLDQMQGSVEGDMAGGAPQGGPQAPAAGQPTPGMVAQGQQAAAMSQQPGGPAIR